MKKIFSCVLALAVMFMFIISPTSVSMAAFAVNLADETSTFGITGGEENTDYTYEDYLLVILSDKPMMLSGTTTEYGVEIKSGVNAKLTFDGLVMDSSVTVVVADGASLELTLLGENSLNSSGTAGLDVSAGAALTITKESTGSLYTKGGKYCAGIGGGKYSDGGTITINGGTITAVGGGFPELGYNNCGAGIGGGDNGDGGIITINGGSVTATGGIFCSGIGGGFNGDGGIITINGGTVEAHGDGAGIGGGDMGDGGTININGGVIIAEGSVGIGGQAHYDGAVNDITITGGTITATGSGGAGIGCFGGYNTNIGSVVIEGGDITAVGGAGAAGIGGGMFSSGGDITITGGNITAVGGEYKPEYYPGEEIEPMYGAGIGGGSYGDSGSFSTGEDGNAFINASSISDTSKQDEWNGVIFDGDEGQVYGDVTLSGENVIPSGKTLTVPGGNSSTVENGGVLRVEEGAVLTVEEGASLTVEEGSELVLDGSVVLNGTVENNGEITGDGQFIGNEDAISGKGTSDIIPGDCVHPTSNLETLSGREPTCTENGLTDGKKCKICGEITQAQETVPAVGHKYENGECTVCGHINYIINDGVSADVLSVLPDNMRLEISESELDELTENYLKESGEWQAAGSYSINVFEDETQISETEDEIIISFEIPTELRAKDRVFAVLRTHYGNVNVLEDTDSKADFVTIKTNKFSVYTLVYKTAAAEPETPDEPESSGGSSSSGSSSSSSDSTSDDEPAYFIDKDTGVIATADAGVLPDGAKLAITPVADETNDAQITYDISFTDENGEEIQPNGNVTVKIVIPEKFKNAEKIYVYREESDGTYTDMKATIEDSMIVFTTDHFSRYILTADEITAPAEMPAPETTTSDPSGGTTKPTNPYTGVPTAFIPIAVTAIVSGAIVVATRKRK